MFDRHIQLAGPIEMTNAHVDSAYFAAHSERISQCGVEYSKYHFAVMQTTAHLSTPLVRQRFNLSSLAISLSLLSPSVSLSFPFQRIDSYFAGITLPFSI